MMGRGLALLFFACGAFCASAAVQEDGEAGSPPAAARQEAPPGPGTLPAPIQHLREPFFGDLEALRKRAMVRVLVAYSAGGFYNDRGELRGFDAELMNHYGDHLNGLPDAPTPPWAIAFIPVPFDRLIPDLLAGHGDVVAAGLTVTDLRERQVEFSDPYLRNVDEVVVAHADVAGELTSLDHLAGRSVYVTRGSSHAEHLAAIDASFRERGLATIDVVQLSYALRVDDLMELANTGVFPITVADRHQAERWAELLPHIVVLPELAIHRGGELALAVRPGSEALRASLNDYLGGARKGTLLGNILYKRYFQQTDWLERPSSEKLAKLAPIFRRYAERYGFDWLGVAAQAYQESGMDQSRRSSMGAVGIMQIKPSTAADRNVGVPDVHDLESNIHAGVKYLAFLRDRYFDDPAISQADRFFFSLAAYNMGPARVISLRKRAAEEGLDANRWFDQVEAIAHREVGREPVRYVSNIAKYYAAYELMFRDLEERKTQRRVYQASEGARGSDEPK